MGLFAKFKVTLGFKSGRRITFKCDKAEVTYAAGALTGYSFDEIRGPSRVFVLSEIESVAIQRLVS